jgi:hypothetical protein
MLAAAGKLACHAAGSRRFGDRRRPEQIYGLTQKPMAADSDLIDAREAVS